jgi:enoyl-CoA hydratase
VSARECAADDLVVERTGAVLVLTINRPSQRNAMTLAVARRIAQALDVLDDDADLRACVMTGAGGTFCAGMDLKRFAAGERPSVPGRGFAGFVERPPRKPMIAAVEGWALGGGFEIAMACDLVVAGDGAGFGLPEVTRGLVARGGGAIRLPQLVPRAVAMELLLTGQPLNAARAAQIGLVNRVVADGGARDAAIELAAVIAANAPLAVSASKQIALSSREWRTQDAFLRQAEITDPVFASDDAIEGARAFAERRTPVWRSR